MRRRSRPGLAPALLLAVALAAAPASRAAGPDWNALAGVDTVEIVSTNEDGSPRDTTVWLVVVDGEGYVRTGNTRWGANVERSPDVLLRVGGEEHALRAERVSNAPLIATVMQAFRDKYGLWDVAAGVLPGAGSKVLHLVPPTSLPLR
jgi:hypothetical protein